MIFRPEIGRLIPGLLLAILFSACASPSLVKERIRIDVSDIEEGGYIAHLEILSTRWPAGGDDFAYSEARLIVKSKISKPLYFKTSDISLHLPEGTPALVRRSLPADISGISIYRLRENADLEMELTITTASSADKITFTGIDFGGEEKQNQYREAYDQFYKEEK